ncbi:MAG TPA: phosphomannomutase/phosphoglucomutase [Planctomycetota bacterium]|nr:phosphomannomutase/phosphoglucomutase [Planctomycetota bacterium]
MTPFKAYDIRGRYPDVIDDAFAERLGGAVTRFLGAKRIAVGRDARLSAPAVAAAVARGASGEVLDLGLCTTPMLYYAVGHFGLDGGIMVTASHNPPEDIGFKICRAKAAPVGERTGLREIEALMAERPTGGARVAPADIVPAYREHLRRALAHPPRLRVAVDCANGAVGAHFDALFDGLPLAFERLYFEPDGRFPNHPPDPIRDENVRALQDVVRRTRADLGVAFDGDGDRCMFFGPDGGRLPGDLITVLLARAELQRRPGSAVVYDLRSSRVVPEEIARAGGRPIRERVGHSFIKETMKREDAVLGGELSGHYYFRDHYFADSGLLAFAKVLDLLGREGRPIGELLSPLRRTVHTGEINFRVEDREGLFRRLTETFADGRQDRLDGLTVEYADWWFNVRASNTEPLVRLNLEALSGARLAEVKARLFGLLGTPV